MTLSQEITESEFPIMKILWENDELSIREVHDRLSKQKEWAYSTTKTTMDRMVKKGLLKRESKHHVFLYSAIISKAQGMLKWVHFIADGFFASSPQDVVAMFTDSGALSAQEADELRALIDEDLR